MSDSDISDSNDVSAELQELCREALAQGMPLDLVGGASKRFLGRLTQARELQVAHHRGLISYEPTELVVTARAGTPLRTLESVLADENQMLAFEPPHFGDHATIGGTIACGLSGPRRPFVGAARDFVLGTKIINGKGELLSFGGQVMKNVAGYDVSRLMCGAMGTLGILLEISLKVLPKPAYEQTLCFELDASTAIDKVNRWAATPLPLTGACHDGEYLRVRLGGSELGVLSAAKELGGQHEQAAHWWQRLREHNLEFFASSEALWRVSVPPATTLANWSGKTLLDWGGALRWYKGDEPTETIRCEAARHGGHATLFRYGDHTGDVFHPLSAGVAGIHQRLKQAFDPGRLFNRGRLYPDL